MGIFFRVVGIISEWSGKMISFFIPIVVAVTVYEVIARYVFNKPTVWALTISLYLFGISVLIAGAYVLRRGGHVRVDVLYAKWSPRTQAIVDLLTFTIFFVFCFILFWKGMEVAGKAIAVRETSRLSQWEHPVYWLKAIVPLGAGLILLEGLTKYIRDIITAVTGRLPSISLEKRLPEE